MKIYYSNNFIKKFEKLSLSLQLQVENRLEIFKDNPRYPLLNNHNLKGKWLGHRSINITGDYRAIYHESEIDIATFDTVDTHSNLYG